VDSHPDGQEDGLGLLDGLDGASLAMLKGVGETDDGPHNEEFLDI